MRRVCIIVDDRGSDSALMKTVQAIAMQERVEYQVCIVCNHKRHQALYDHPAYFLEVPTLVHVIRRALSVTNLPVFTYLRTGETWLYPNALADLMEQLPRDGAVLGCSLLDDASVSGNLPGAGVYTSNLWDMRATKSWQQFIDGISHIRHYPRVVHRITSPQKMTLYARCCFVAKYAQVLTLQQCWESIRCPRVSFILARQCQ